MSQLINMVEKIEGYRQANPNLQASFHKNLSEDEIKMIKIHFENYSLTIEYDRTTNSYTALIPMWI